MTKGLGQSRALRWISGTAWDVVVRDSASEHWRNRDRRIPSLRSFSAGCGGQPGLRVEARLAHVRFYFHKNSQKSQKGHRPCTTLGGNLIHYLLFPPFVWFYECLFGHPGGTVNREEMKPLAVKTTVNHSQSPLPGCKGFFRLQGLDSAPLSTTQLLI